ncbi:hypothetical protein [Sphingomonas sp. HMP6]|uniref:hypothetical protein n=1 Tax=Sphingomonas sp. HMP6 TaxID=1517551 RepID=UPI001596B234|nr:hypothetical protein [Sphingomonas sp. HMP6]BCA60214.1 hypothetical protein HMP06_2983 [Sphingomonas sp. HMP6]
MSANLVLISSRRTGKSIYPAALRDLIDAIDFTAVEEGAAPMPETVEAIVRHLAKLYPNGGNQFCAAIEQAVRLAWRARHEIQKIRETQS